MSKPNYRDALVAAMRATASSPPTGVDVGGAWGRVYVRPPTVAEVDAALKAGEPDDGRMLARGACRVLCDETGKRIFDASNRDDVELLAAQPYPILQRITAAARSDATDAGDLSGN
jgi:hypothetical protein